MSSDVHWAYCVGKTLFLSLLILTTSSSSAKTTEIGGDEFDEDIPFRTVCSKDQLKYLQKSTTVETSKIYAYMKGIQEE